MQPPVNDIMEDKAENAAHIRDARQQRLEVALRNSRPRVLDARSSLVNSYGRNIEGIMSKWNYFPQTSVSPNQPVASRGATSAGGAFRITEQHPISDDSAQDQAHYYQYSQVAQNPVISVAGEATPYDVEAMAFASQHQQTVYTPPTPPNGYSYVQHGGHVPVQSPFSPAPPMPANPPMTPMDVLSAERYDTRLSENLNKSARKRRIPASNESILPFGINDNRVGVREQSIIPSDDGGDAPAAKNRRSKKPRLSEDDEGEEDSGTRSRGRPRLDTKDETAADRRRTQIRLAQRAYRNRKETTIVALEKQVQDLRSTNEEMSNMFMNLYDFAMKRGLVEREPEFAQHLQSTTAQFLSLSNTVGDEVVKSERIVPEPERKKSILDSESRVDVPNENVQVPQRSVQSTSVWGYQINNDSTASSLLDYTPQSASRGNLNDDHLIITTATPDNASFSGFDASMYNNVQGWRVQVPETTEVFQQYTKIQEPLPLASTYSQSETTFARRLARYAAERGYKLLNLEHKFPRRFNEVFAFSLQFSTRETIAARLLRIISGDSTDSLYAWWEPFVHLGGAGTYYPNFDNTTVQGMPKFRTGMSMGPFSDSVMETKSNAVMDDFRMNFPGFTGEFFDPNDVESYLLNKGIDLSSNPDFVEINLDGLSLSGTDETVSTGPPLTPRDAMDFGNVMGEPGPLSQEKVLEPWIDLLFDNSRKEANQSAGPISINFGEWYPGSGQRKSLIPSPPKLLKTNSSTGPEESFVPVSTRLANSPAQRIVTLSVAVLINELISEAKCLGRTTGFKASGVDAAIKRAIDMSL